jgi:hypothetical protein
MTAETAVLNKSAVALAADSAITIGRGDKAKIFNTFNKIFELSRNQPIALMIYNRVDFMGLPLETIIKMFRREHARESYASVLECSNHFLEFLEDEVSFDEVDVQSNTWIILNQAVNALFRDFQTAISSEIRKTGKYLVSKENKLADQVLKKKIATLNALNPAECFLPGDLRTILNGYENIIAQMLNSSECPLIRPAGYVLRNLKRYCRLVLHRNRFSTMRTGLVFAGFGQDEICPSMVAYEIDGVVSGKLKKVKNKHVDIDRDGAGADLSVFAQRDVAESFITGVDPSFDSYVKVQFREVLDGFARDVVQATIANPAARAPILDALQAPIEQQMEQLTSKFEKFKDDLSRKDILNLIQYMPKEEIARLADSLVELTSLKRRVSYDRETVGGEVDLAVITKAEGLVWIKRKHYFPQDINPRYFSRNQRAYV